MATSEHTFDWIFFAIVLLPAVYLVWDWQLNRRAPSQETRPVTRSEPGPPA